MIRVHSYESMGTLDGPGLRLVVFLQGCPLRCLYCANPDTIDPVGESTLTDPNEILKMAIDQRPFFGKRGGITFSGGEPTLQARELIPLFEALRAEGIHIALDTNGAIWSEDARRLQDLTNLVLLDVKHINPGHHTQLTGKPNANTLATARRLRDRGIDTWLRYVLVPGISEDPADIDAWADEFSDYPNVSRVELLPYHTLGRHKYEAMGLAYPLAGTPLNTPAQVEAARSRLAARFKCPVVAN